MAIIIFNKIPTKQSAKKGKNNIAKIAASSADIVHILIIKICPHVKDRFLKTCPFKKDASGAQTKANET